MAFGKARLSSGVANPTFALRRSNGHCRALVLAMGLCSVLAARAEQPPPARAVALSIPAQPVRSTPLTLRIDHAPVPVQGSDGRLHVVYEIELANRTGSAVDLEVLDVLDAASGAVLARFDATQLAPRLVVRERGARPGRLGASQLGMLYVHLALSADAAAPAALDHRVQLRAGSGRDDFVAGRTAVGRPTDLVLDPPLRGPRFIAGDGCCQNTRHMHASLSLNGRLHTAQRYAIDWEQLDAQGRIVVGDPKNPASYTIYGQPAHAVADARVVVALDGLPDSPPGRLPPDLQIAQADGNHVVLDLGQGRYALYAHLQPGSVRVRAGEQVQRGQVLGLVGTSGNSSEPHLHFQLMDQPSALAANGLPYRLARFTATARGVSTQAFDQAIADGQPIATEPVAGPGPRQGVLPLDLWIVDFPSEVLPQAPRP